MVYKPELDRQGFVDRQRISQERNRPAIQFTRRDDVREMMSTPRGRNYGNMMDLQNQAIRLGGFEKGDPRVSELKAARRQYNRQDKYNIGNLMGYEPLDVQDIYRKNSGVLREYARPTYKEMYPISDAFHEVVGSGGITGMLLNQAIGRGKKAGKNFFDDLRGMGADIFKGIGIGGAVAPEEATEEVLQNYADKTFGPYPKDIHPGLPIEEPLLVDDEPELTRDEQIAQVLEDPGIRTDAEFLLTPEKTEEDLRREQLLKELEENMVFSDAQEVPDEPLPFEDPRTESGIANLMPGGILHDRIPWNQRLNTRVAEQMLEEGPHETEPRTSYYGSNWYDEYKRKLENEMEIAKGIRAPMDR